MLHIYLSAKFSGVSVNQQKYQNNANELYSTDFTVGFKLTHEAKAGSTQN